MSRGDTKRKWCAGMVVAVGLAVGACQGSVDGGPETWSFAGVDAESGPAGERPERKTDTGVSARPDVEERNPLACYAGAMAYDRYAIRWSFGASNCGLLHVTLLGSARSEIEVSPPGTVRAGAASVACSRTSVFGRETRFVGVDRADGSIEFSRGRRGSGDGYVSVDVTLYFDRPEQKFPERVDFRNDRIPIAHRRESSRCP